VGGKECVADAAGLAVRGGGGREAAGEGGEGGGGGGRGGGGGGGGGGSMEAGSIHIRTRPKFAMPGPK
jgi:hypothetical protein